MKKSVKKLFLSRETVRLLQEGLLAEAQGGTRPTAGLVSHCYPCGTNERNCTTMTV